MKFKVTVACVVFALLILVALLPLLHTALVSPVYAASFTVNSTTDLADSNPGDGVCETAPGNGVCTLRAAIQEANARAGNDTISLPAGTYTLTLPGRDENLSATGDLDIASALTIQGAGAETCIIDGNHIDRVFDIHSPAVVTIEGVSIRNGMPGTNYSVGGGIFTNADTSLVLRNSTVRTNIADWGAGVTAEGTLHIDNGIVETNVATTTAGGINIGTTGRLTMTASVIRGNRAGWGAGMSHFGHAVISTVSITGNVATNNGGGIDIGDTGTISLTDTFIGSNQAGFGGGISNWGTASMTAMTVHHNEATDGGGIAVGGSGSLTLTHSSVTSNIADSGVVTESVGGGINNNGILTLEHVTIATNTADYAGGIANWDQANLKDIVVEHNSASVNGGGIGNGGSMSLAKGIVADNSAGWAGGINNWGVATVTDITVTRNHADHNSGGVEVKSSGAFTITSGTVASNTADVGGGIGIWARTTFTDVTLEGNTATTGGGIHIGDSGILWLNNSAVRHNDANVGGGVSNRGQSILSGASVAENRASVGGGIAVGNSGRLTVTASTVSTNTADSGAVYNSGGTIRLHNSTVSGNDASFGGGIYNTSSSTTTLSSVTISNNSAADSGDSVFNDGEVDFENTIVSTQGINCAGTGSFLSQGYNLDSGDSCMFSTSGDLVNTDPLLGPLHDNGGGTLTHALLAGSPALDAGDASACPATDQRDIVRPLDGDGDGTPVCDIGAYEAPLRVIVDPNAGGTLVYTDTQGSQTKIDVPAGAVSETTTLVYTPLDTLTSPSNFAFAGHGFDLEAHHNEGLKENFTFQQPVAVTIRYSDADVTGVDEETLTLRYWEGTEWVDAASSCTPESTYHRDMQNNILRVDICHLSRFGLFGSARYQFLPVVLR